MRNSEKRWNILKSKYVADRKTYVMFKDPYGSGRLHGQEGQLHIDT